MGPQNVDRRSEEKHAHISRYLWSRYEDDPEELKDRDVIQDETLVHHFDPESKKQSMQWKPWLTPPKKFRRSALVG